MCYLSISLVQRFPVIFQRKPEFRHFYSNTTSEKLFANHDDNAEKVSANQSSKIEDVTVLSTTVVTNASESTERHGTQEVELEVVSKSPAEEIEEFHVVDEFQTVKVPHETDGPFTVLVHYYP